MIIDSLMFVLQQDLLVIFLTLKLLANVKINRSWTLAIAHTACNKTQFPPLYATHYFLLLI